MGSSIEQAYSAIAQSDAVLAMRLHALLLAHLAGIPAVALEYEDKVRSMNDDLGTPASQRLGIGEITSRLGPALQIVTGDNRGAAFRVSREQASDFGQAALKHRGLLWHAMDATQKSPPSGELAQHGWLTQWNAEVPEGMRRTLAAVEARLHGQIATNSNLRAGNAEARGLLDRLRADNRRLSAGLAEMNVSRDAEKSARIASAEARVLAEAQLETWRTLYHAAINSRS